MPYCSSQKMRNIFTLEFYTHCKTGVITLAKSFFIRVGGWACNLTVFHKTYPIALGVEPTA